MKRSGWIILVVALFSAVPLAATETLNQCLINCPPGNNSCSQCCFAQFDSAKGPCYDGCSAAQNPCFDAAYRSCQGNPNPSWCIAQASAPCQEAIYSCQRTCDGSVQIAGGCPGEVPPQKCPYTCQMWNPASQSCIGPLMNGCNFNAARESADPPDIMTERAKAAADAAAAHTEKLKQENAKKTTKKRR